MTGYSNYNSLQVATFARTDETMDPRRPNYTWARSDRK